MYLEMTRRLVYEAYRNIPIAAKIQNNLCLYLISRQTRRVKLYFRVKTLSFKRVFIF